mmetsp:Transcript_25156/g.65421  ORF Transcript_25156/g.65421 Transcript_25156/m.65421 type:complete len:254 (+) Transcript_25156:167-928(+)
MGEKTLPNSEPPNTQPKQCVSNRWSPPPNSQASGPISGNRMPIVPKLEPVAKEMTYDNIEVEAGRAQAGRPPDVSAAAMKEAVPVAWMMPPRAHASASTIIGSMTSFMPSTTVPMAVSRSKIFCERSNDRAAAQPNVEPHNKASTESPLARACMTVTLPIWPEAFTAFLPSRIIPPKVAPMIVPKGTNALTARKGVWGAGSMAPMSGAASPLSSSTVDVSRSLLTTASRMGPKSRPVETVAATKASRQSGKKR